MNKIMNIKMDSLYKVIGERLKKKRTELGKKQGEMATDLNLSRTSITNIELGVQKAPLHLIYKFCCILNIEINEVIPTLKELENRRNIKVHGIMTDEISRVLDDKLNINDKGLWTTKK